RPERTDARPDEADPQRPGRLRDLAHVGVERRGAGAGRGEGPARKLQLAAGLHRDPIALPGQGDDVSVLAGGPKPATLQVPEQLGQPADPLVGDRPSVVANTDLLL